MRYEVVNFFLVQFKVVFFIVVYLSSYIAVDKSNRTAIERSWGYSGKVQHIFFLCQFLLVPDCWPMTFHFWPCSVNKWNTFVNLTIVTFPIGTLH